MPREFKDAMWVLGALVSASALISIIERITDVGLAPYLAEMLDYYRALTAPIADLLLAALSLIGLRLDLWTWYDDALPLSFVGAGIYTRVVPEHVDLGTGAILRTIVITVVFLLFGYSLLGLVVPVLAFCSWDKANEDAALWSAVRRSVAWSFIAVVVFFFSNHLLTAS